MERANSLVAAVGGRLCLLLSCGRGLGKTELEDMLARLRLAIAELEGMLE